MLEAVDTDALASLDLAGDIDLTCRIMTDQDHRQPRPNAMSAHHLTDVVRRLRVEMSGKCFAVDNLSHRPGACSIEDVPVDP
ncbi:hypothetical protein GCM10010990_28610 [Croceicoccus mobilis]|uniref:Uncharacterized protein n=1 Tax=Croceicoccus mobilis TaxID=1703339 RepID=A0A917DX54_9SPHN|nr:hypothetical protein GCM10010990_28610 [Croceicoccus mobilis]